MDTEEALKVGRTFGRAVKIRRIEIGYTQEELADKAGLARSFVSGIERGAAKASIASVWQIAERIYFSD